MKRAIIILMLMSCAAVFAWAQDGARGERRAQRGQRREACAPGRDAMAQRLHRARGAIAERAAAAESVTVSGTLAVARGRIVVSSGGTTYVVGGLHRLVGFVDGLREGAAVTVQGLAFPAGREGVVVLRGESLTLDGRSYELAAPRDRSREHSLRGGQGRARPGRPGGAN